MLLTISTTNAPAADLAYLLRKHPDRCQSFDLAFGKAQVFYPTAGEDRCSISIQSVWSVADAGPEDNKVGSPTQMGVFRCG